MSDMEKSRRSSVNSAKQSDEDKTMKKSEKSDAEDLIQELEEKPTESSQSESTQATLSTERRSSRIMTRKQRDSELRLNFAKKLKTNPTDKKDGKAPTRTPVRYNDLTSDSETPTSSKKVTKKPLLGNKRKSNLEYSKNQKKSRQDHDTTTTDDNDTEESDHITTPNINNAKRKVHLNNSKLGKLKKKMSDFSDEETEESDHKSNKAVPRKVNPNAKVSKVVNKVINISDDETDDIESLVKKKPMNAKVAKLVKKRKDEFSDETEDSSGLEEDLKKAIITKFPTYKSLNNFCANQSLPNSEKKPTPRPPMTILKRPSQLQKTSQNKPKEIIRNISNVNMFAKSTNGKKINSLKIYCPEGEKTPPRPLNNINRLPSSPQVKSDFDRLVDELFEEDATRKRREPEFMMIGDEPTDVYTLSIDDTLDDDEDLEALCEEVEEDVLEESPAPVENPFLFTPDLGPKPKIFDIKKPFGAFRPPISSNSLKKEILRPEVKPHMNNIKSPQNKTKTLVLPKTPVTPSTVNKVQATNSSGKPTKMLSYTITPAAKPPAPVKSTSETNIDYKEKYNKLQVSYEALSKKIAQYMDKTSKEKDNLKKQLRLERNKCNRLNEDLDKLNSKLQYLMKNKLSMVKKKS